MSGSYYKIWSIKMGVILMTTLTLFIAGCTKKSIVGPPVDIPFARLLEGESLQSKINGQAVKYSVLLPADYKTSGLSYPVVYLLHGFGDDYTAWTKGGNIQLFADNLGAEIVPMIFVMPDGYNTYYVNNYNGTNRYMDVFTTELVPEIDKIYRTKKDASQRAVMGYSMGGYGALILPSKNPGLFKISVPLSMSFRTDQQYTTESQGSFNSQWAPIFGGIGLTGAARLTEYFKLNSPFYYFDKSNLSAFDGLKLLLDCGDDEEQLSETSGALHNLLRERNLPHEYRMGNGSHSWSYWYKELPEALRFISKSFQQESYPQEPAPVSIGTLIPEEQYVQETLVSTTTKLGIFKPASYSTSSSKFPVIYYINESPESERKTSAIKVMSFLNNNILNGKIPPSLIVEIPYGQSGVSSSAMAGIVQQIKANYRTVSGKEGMVLMGAGKGGLNAWTLMPECRQIIKNCFLFDATLPDGANAQNEVYYYLDATDNTTAYKGYHSLYLDLRLKKSDHEYRVRQGNPSFQSFINGLDASWNYLSRQLKN